jgi:hypothetical protein
LAASSERRLIVCSWNMPMSGDLIVVKDRMTGVEAAAKVMYHLAQGEAMTPSLIAAMTGWERQDCLRLLKKMSRVVPIYPDAGKWWMVRP